MSANCPLGNCGLVFFDEANLKDTRQVLPFCRREQCEKTRIALKSRMKLGAFSSARFNTSLDLLMTNDDKDLII